MWEVDSFINIIPGAVVAFQSHYSPDDSRYRTRKGKG